MSCSVNDQDLRTSDREVHQVYFMVTHGPTTDAGFWGDVLLGTLDKARELGVEVIPLHPAVEASGALLNEQMLQAINVNPPGIIATIWGEGMPDTVKVANAQGIPIAAINVYPDPSVFGEGAGKAHFLLYAGQNDGLAAVDVTHGIICSTVDKKLINDMCEEQSVHDTFVQISSDKKLRAVCIVHQQSAGVLTRCAAMKQTMLTEFGMSESEYHEISWDEATPGAGVQAINDYFNDALLADVDHFLVMANGPNGIEPYLAADLPDPVKAKVVLGTFDTSPAICASLTNATIRFASAQGHQDQGKMALDYLHYYVENGVLPPAGKDPRGQDDPRWIVSPDGFHWYKTGPQLLYERCL